MSLYRMQSNKTLNIPSGIDMNHPTLAGMMGRRIKLSFSGAFPTITINGQAHTSEPSAEFLVNSTNKGFCPTKRSSGKDAWLMATSHATIPLVSTRGEE